MSWCTLGDCQIFHLRYLPGLRMFEKIWSSPADRVVQSGGPFTGIPPQAILTSRSLLNGQYAREIFDNAKYGCVRNIQKHDVFVLVSDGITDNMGEADFLTEMSNGWNHNEDPTEMARRLVSTCLRLTKPYPEGKPDDTTAVVSIVCGEW